MSQMKAVRWISDQRGYLWVALGGVVRRGGEEGCMVRRGGEEA